MAKVELQGILKAFGATPVLHGVDLAVRDGEFVAIVGPSGCGKSTLLRILAGLETADAGRVAIGGRDVTGERASRRDLAMVFQSYALYPHLSVAENIAVPLRMRELSAAQRFPGLGRVFGGPRAAIVRRVEDLAGKLEIEHLLARKPGQLPAGSGSAWRWHARSCVSRRRSCSTSRCRTSTPSCESTPERRSRSFTAGSARRSSTSRTIRSRR